MILHGDCLQKLKELEDNSVDAVITDPPYGLSFMGKKWDYDVPNVEIWSECLRVLKPGGYLLAFAGTRTQHRMAVRIEDAGFEIRDMIAWVYGSGFPKSLNIGKAVDKLQGNDRENLGVDEARAKRLVNQMEHSNPTGTWQAGKRIVDITKGTSEWEGWGTALKPALEPITVARKPIEGTVAENCLKWGVGGINIDGSRVESNEQIETGRAGRSGASNFNASIGEEQPNHSARFPANLIHDNSEEVRECFPETKQPSFRNGDRVSNNNGLVPWNKGRETGREVKGAGFSDTGNASRFFYCAKSSKSERTMNGTITNGHPTIKPLKLMKYLVNLVSKQGHTVLDPFMGSGTTGIACKKLGRNFIGIEREEEYVKIAEARINAI